MPKQSQETLDRQLRSVRIKHDLSKTTIVFADIVDTEPLEGDDESSVIRTTYAAESGHRPHADFINSMKRLLPHSFAVAEIKVSDKNPSQNYTISGLDISGDLGMNQSRVSLVISKLVERTGKIMIFPPTPQVTLSDESDYEDWKDLKKLVQKVEDEAWKFLQGKHEGDTIQLAFSFSEEAVVKSKPIKKKQPETAMTVQY